MKYIISIEGQNIELPEEVGADDHKVKQALAPFFPGAATAKITRATKDDVTTVTVIKQAGTKGADIFLVNLIELQEKENPVIELFTQLRGFNPTTYPKDRLILLESQIAEAKEEGHKQNEILDHTFSRLRESRPQPIHDVVLGF